MEQGRSYDKKMKEMKLSASIVFACFVGALMMVLVKAAWGWGSPPPVKPAPVPEVVIKPIELPETSAQNYLAVTAKVTGTVSQTMRLARLSEGMEVVLNTPEFKERVLGQHWKRQRKFFDTELTNEQVYEKIRAAREIQDELPGVVELEMEVSKSRCSTLGWTYPNVKKFWFNTCGFDDRKDSGLVGTMCHEWTHKLGFKHSVNYTADRPYSAPYSVGTICAEIYDKLSKAEAAAQ